MLQACLLACDDHVSHPLHSLIRRSIRSVQRNVSLSIQCNGPPLSHTAMTTSTVPHDFLLGPGRPKILKAVVDFERNKLPEYKGHYATILDNAFTKDECDTLVRAAEARSNGAWEPAMINIGGGEQILLTDARDCGRIIWDDTDLVERIWSRIEDSVPEIALLKDMPLVTGKWPVLRGETWKMTRLNERMRFLKYGPGQYFGRERLFFSIFNPPFFDRICRVLTGFSAQ